MPYLKHPLIDGGRYGVSIVAHVHYYIQRPSGNGRDEPRDPGGPELISVELQHVNRTVREVQEKPIPGDVPQWVYDVLEDQRWYEAVDLDDGPDGDDLRDAARDRDLVEER